MKLVLLCLALTACASLPKRSPLIALCSPAIVWTDEDAFRAPLKEAVDYWRSEGFDISYKARGLGTVYVQWGDCAPLSEYGCVLASRLRTLCQLGSVVWIGTAFRNASPRHVKHLFRHELGHVLGFDDSPYDHDLMGPYYEGAPIELSRQERELIGGVK